MAFRPDLDVRIGRIGAVKLRYRRENWLDLGLSQLAQHGAEALKLDAICKTAGVTKGSFYHHFEDHGGFLAQLTEEWVRRQTSALIDEIPDGLSASEMAQQLTELVLKTDYRLELGIRELSRRHKDLAKIVRDADKMRQDYVAGLYAAQFDLDAEAAQDAAALEYAAFIGIIALDPDMPEDHQRRLVKRFGEMAQALYRQ